MPNMETPLAARESLIVESPTKSLLTKPKKKRLFQLACEIISLTNKYLEDFVPIKKWAPDQITSDQRRAHLERELGRHRGTMGLNEAKLTEIVQAAKTQAIEYVYIWLVEEFMSMRMPTFYIAGMLILAEEALLVSI